MGGRLHRPPAPARFAGEPGRRALRGLDVTEIHRTLRNRIIESISLVVLLGIGFIVVFIIWAGRNVTRPIEQLERSAVEFASKCRDQKDADALKIETPNIRANNEMAKNEALAEALSLAEEASKAKTTFLSNMSHEIRTPMNAIIGLDTLALRDETLTPQTREYLEKIGGSARHLLALINDILDMSRIESGRLVLRKEEFSFSGMLEQINTMVMSQCSDKGLHYECRILSLVDDYYIGDDMKLKEVLINILSNAIKFTDAPGSVTLTLERTAHRNNMSLFKEKKRAALAGRRILLPEDMEINAEIMMDVLEMEDMETDHAENGRIVVDMFKNSAPGTYSAILMDVRMPVMDGLEATAAIRALDRPDAKRIPIIALTANAFDEDVQHSLQAGMNAHLSKPVEPNLLYQTLGELIYGAEAE